VLAFLLRRRKYSSSCLGCLTRITSSFNCSTLKDNCSISYFRIIQNTTLKNQNNIFAHVLTMWRLILGKWDHHYRRGIYSYWTDGLCHKWKKITLKLLVDVVFKILFSHFHNFSSEARN
jgi:hypothetical protein